MKLIMLNQKHTFISSLYTGHCLTPTTHLEPDTTRTGAAAVAINLI